MKKYRKCPALQISCRALSDLCKMIDCVAQSHIVEVLMRG